MNANLILTPQATALIQLGESWMERSNRLAHEASVVEVGAVKNAEAKIYAQCVADLAQVMLDAYPPPDKETAK